MYFRPSFRALTRPNNGSDGQNGAAAGFRNALSLTNHLFRTDSTNRDAITDTKAYLRLRPFLCAFLLIWSDGEVTAPVRSGKEKASVPGGGNEDVLVSSFS